MLTAAGSRDNTLEICGASYKKLPMYLNRQLVKILEDRGVPPSVFLALQNQAVQKLSYITKNPINAARFLDQNRIASGARVSRLIRLLNSIGLSFHHDEFLREVVETAAIIQLRDLKHRARIPIEKGFTLYGTVDETGLLKEGQIYVPTRDSDGTLNVVVGSCLVT